MAKKLEDIQETSVYLNYSRFIAGQIAVQRKNMWVSVSYAVILLVLGLGTTLFSLATNFEGERASELFKMGPFLVSAAVSVFPIKGIMGCRVRLICYRHLKYCLDHHDDLPRGELQELLKTVRKLREDVMIPKD
jgi:hypothetical protein